MSTASAEIRELLETAKKARESAYSPYSKHKVGAAVRLSNGRIFSGCNVENSSYGGTVCAERVAIFKAVSEATKPITLADLVVVTDASPPWPPCGLCTAQVVAEFATKETRIYSANLKGEMTSLSFDELVPYAFTPDHLLKK